MHFRISDPSFSYVHYVPTIVYRNCRCFSFLRFLLGLYQLNQSTVWSYLINITRINKQNSLSFVRIIAFYAREKWERKWRERNVPSWCKFWGLFRDAAEKASRWKFAPQFSFPSVVSKGMISTFLASAFLKKQSAASLCPDTCHCFAFLRRGGIDYCVI